MPLVLDITRRWRQPRTLTPTHQALVLGAAAFVGGTALTASGIVAAGRDLAAGDPIRSDHFQRIDAGRGLINAAATFKEELRRIDRNEALVKPTVHPRGRLYDPCPPGSLRALFLEERSRRP